MFTTRQRRQIATLCAAAGSAAAITLLAAPSANAAPVQCLAPGDRVIVAESDESECAAMSEMASAAAAYGLGGIAAAEAGEQSLALAIAQNGGTATSTAENFAGPAALALGPGATITMTKTQPGLAIAIAGPGATIDFDGPGAATCSGGAAFAGDLLTLTGCMSNG
jgi:hypothetical protein